MVGFVSKNNINKLLCFLIALCVHYKLFLLHNKFAMCGKLFCLFLYYEQVDMASVTLAASCKIDIAMHCVWYANNPVEKSLIFHPFVFVTNWTNIICYASMLEAEYNLAYIMCSYIL